MELSSVDQTFPRSSYPFGYDSVLDSHLLNIDFSLPPVNEEKSASSSISFAISHFSYPNDSIVCSCGKLGLFGKCSFCRGSVYLSEIKSGIELFLVKRPDNTSILVVDIDSFQNDDIDCVILSCTKLIFTPTQLYSSLPSRIIEMKCIQKIDFGPKFLLQNSDSPTDITILKALPHLQRISFSGNLLKLDELREFYLTNLSLVHIMCFTHVECNVPLIMADIPMLQTCRHLCLSSMVEYSSLHRVVSVPQNFIYLDIVVMEMGCGSLDSIPPEVDQCNLGHLSLGCYNNIPLSHRIFNFKNLRSLLIGRMYDHMLQYWLFLHPTLQTIYMSKQYYDTNHMYLHHLSSTIKNIRFLDYTGCPHHINAKVPNIKESPIFFQELEYDIQYMETLSEDMDNINMPFQNCLQVETNYDMIPSSLLTPIELAAFQAKMEKKQLTESQEEALQNIFWLNKSL